MSEKQLGKALLELDADRLAAVPDARQQTWQIVERDRRRVWWLTAVTIALWAAAIGLVLWMIVAYGLLFPKQAQLQMDIRAGRIKPEVREQVQATHQIALQMITLGVAVSVGVLCLAALSTVLLVLASRRATLRQINASLMEISQQLKQLRQAPTAASGSAAMG
jgi:ABC-type Fe3+ transport system permease subunit